MPLVESSALKAQIDALNDEDDARIDMFNDAVEQIVVEVYGENYGDGADQTVVIDGRNRTYIPLPRKAQSITSITPDATAYLSTSGKYLDFNARVNGLYTVVFTPFNDDAKRKMAISVGVETAFLAPAGLSSVSEDAYTVSFSGTGLQRIRNAIQAVMGAA